MTTQKAFAQLVSQHDPNFQLMLDSVHDYAIFMLDIHGKIETWNKGATYISGYSTDEIIGVPFSRLFILKETNTSKLETILDTTIKARRFEEENWLRHKNGNHYWATIVISSISHLSEKSIIGFAVVIRDISERKSIRDSLQQSEEKLRLMIESVGDYGIFMLDPRGYIAGWNRGAEQIKGYKANEIIGRHFSCFYPQEDKDNGKPDMELGGAAATGRFEDEGWRLKKDGTRFWANVVISAVRDKTGTLRGFTKVTRDLTERRYAEESLRKSEQRLLSANKELEAFSYSVSHDLRSPLRAITGYSRILEDEYSENLSGQQKGLLKKIQTATTKMSELINALLKLSHIGRHRLNMKKVHVDEIVQNIVADLKEDYQPRDVKVIIGELPNCLGDPILIKQVFENLISNAFKFTSKGDQPVIEIMGQQESKQIVYQIKDNGAGFNMEYIKNLFGVFQRLHQSDEFPGHGVGLSIVQRIVSRHEGKVWALGETGKGASFYFSLPSLDKN